VKLNTLKKAILIAVSAMAVGTCVAHANPGKTQSNAKKITLVGTGNPNDLDPDQLYIPPGSVTATDPNPVGIFPKHSASGAASPEPVW
jgi:hypothetical protein